MFLLLYIYKISRKGSDYFCGEARTAYLFTVTQFNDQFLLIISNSTYSINELE
jgi:hypothetical protein